MSAADIAAALGGARREGRQWRCMCPLHGGHCLVLADGREGRLLVRCWGGRCDPQDLLAELRRRRLIAGRREDARTSCITVRSDVRTEAGRRIALARRIWSVARVAQGSPVVASLADRGITIPVPPALRWAPSLRRSDGTYAPAIVTPSMAPMAS
jgi:hypothetical protein